MLQSRISLEMAVCRSVLYYSPSASFRLVSKSTSPFFINPHKLSLTKLLFLYQNPRRHSHSAIISRTLCLSSSSSSSSSMESAPEGYRRNVGICLINPSKKVSVHLISIICIFTRRFLTPGYVNCADFCCFKAGYTKCLANASGNFEIILYLGLFSYFGFLLLPCITIF